MRIHNGATWSPVWILPLMFRDKWHGGECVLSRMEDRKAVLYKAREGEIPVCNSRTADFFLSVRSLQTPVLLLGKLIYA